MKNYNVIWIDDEWEKQTTFIELCKVKYNIDIMPFRNSKAGMCALENNLGQCDAVILDAKVYDESDNEVATLKGLQSSIKKIESLSNKRKIPYFISTGQPDLYSSDLFKEQFGKFYSKEIDDDELINDLIKAADLQPITHLKHKYKDIWKIYPYEDIFKILYIAENEGNQDSSVFSDIRKVLEWIMQYCNNSGILPIKFNASNLAECSRFLGKGEMQKYVPIHIQRSLHSCVEISNNGSHRLEIDSYVKEGEAPYLLRSTVFELLNVLYWCKSLPSDTDNIEAMRIKIEALNVSIQNDLNPDMFEGVIGQDENGNYFCGEYLLNYRDMNKEDIGKKIKIKKPINNTQDRTKDIYPYFVVKHNLEILD